MVYFTAVQLAYMKTFPHEKSSQIFHDEEHL